MNFSLRHSSDINLPSSTQEFPKFPSTPSIPGPSLFFAAPSAFMCGRIGRGTEGQRRSRSRRPCGQSVGVPRSFALTAHRRKRGLGLGGGRARLDSVRNQGGDEFKSVRAHSGVLRGRQHSCRGHANLFSGKRGGGGGGLLLILAPNTQQRRRKKKS